MMKIKTLFFGITTDLVGTSNLDLELSEASTVEDFKNLLKKDYPQLENLDSYAIAVNESYATGDLILNGNDTVAVIPPVSGG
ncbi:molybdopterin synthase sulfur carrier subunit [Polaribacter sp. Hel1_33_78]|jgi:molybdopterin converting factor subunit 1|uniref:molybdopterin converting factor subunit 1 n=1 Tax=unclassified Polaribacter TaxID=196858 RepID=UPI00052D617D|nr:molybdenum cofactor biosynthesis protein MoaD [Polaribacter sp. Hel1_33_49]PKV65685.1 molybdopterin synthase sulfur carrier subunit [Polaribacter sp. Hel1_33_96]SDT91732.1 molybdopterin synthase sulfur carrier subunit [Polaribacter sp. Hel1_33_78]